MKLCIRKLLSTSCSKTSLRPIPTNIDKLATTSSFSTVAVAPQSTASPTGNPTSSRSTAVVLRPTCINLLSPHNFKRQYCQFSPMAQQNAIFRQLFEHKSFTYTYLIACRKTKDAVLIDPVYEMVGRDEKLVKQLGLNLKYAMNTHVHADHITGSGKLKEIFPECRSVLGSKSGAKADVYLSQGDKLAFGEVELEARATPGHTDGCTTYVWHGAKTAFVGDAVLIRGCGRTDFQQGSASQLYDSVYAQIFSLPDEFMIYPAHDYTGQPWTTVGEEKELNPRLSKSKEQFIEIMKSLNLPYPKQIDRALPANLVCGIFDEADLPPAK